MINWKNEKVWGITSRVFRKLNVYLLFPLGYEIVFNVRKNKWFVQSRSKYNVLENNENE